MLTVYRTSPSPGTFESTDIVPITQKSVFIDISLSPCSCPCPPDPRLAFSTSRRDSSTAPLSAGPCIGVDASALPPSSERPAA
jgi:hypothetical protein